MERLKDNGEFNRFQQGTTKEKKNLQVFHSNHFFSFFLFLFFLSKYRHTRSAYVIEHEAVFSFLNQTYTECCVHQHWDPNSGTSDNERSNENTKKYQHCQLAERLAGACEGQTSHQFRSNLKHGIAGYARPIAAAMLSFVFCELFVLTISICVMWRICASGNVKYKVEKGFSKVEIV